LLSDCNFKIGGKIIEFVSSYSHLGHVVTDSLDDESDMQRIIQDVNNMVTEENSSGCVRFHVCNIRTAVGHQKPHKKRWMH